ncbi:complement receptor type 2-like isoform X2 [Polypterus senegalus]|uniref:complement receptor type 2-like isoform X2 n=1 Tax=Polypterus senegalus TaxID=55291 RepID=UPI001963F6C5|nr:complement receptor type 2-like isoform X2 [Polypterus senegalus]
MKTALCLFGTLVELVVLLGLLGLVTGDCGNPPSVANAAPRSEFLVETVFTDGSKPLFYECIPGYIKEKGNYGITCTGSSWSVPRLVCKRRDCGSPPELYNGEYEITEGTEFGATITAKCHEGYVIEGGDGHLTCGSDGVWFGDSLVCDPVECHIPPEIENGSHFSMGRVQYRSVVIYTCNPGFDMIGNYQITCESNGEYSSPPPKCSKVMCPNINITNGWKISGFNLPYVYQSSITFACDNGFQLNGSSAIVCDESGTWKPDPPTCVKTFGVKCPDPPVIENGSHDPVSSIRSGLVVTYNCNPGFDMIGNHQITCKSNGKYSSRPPKCIKVSCPNINIANGWKISGFGPPYRYKRSITFACNSRF